MGRTFLNGLNSALAVLAVALILQIFSVQCSRLGDQAALSQLKGGDSFLQLGSWRFGMYNRPHFSISHKTGNTVVVFRSDGRPIYGPRRDYNLWEKRGGPVTNVKLLNKCIEFEYVWRLCQIDNSHISLSCLTQQTGVIWRVDGNPSWGPRQDYNGFAKNLMGTNIKFGDRFIQLGYWRIGQVDTNTFSIGTETVVAAVMKSDGSLIHGPRLDNRIQRPITKVLQIQ